MEKGFKGKDILYVNPPFSKTSVNRNGSLWREGQNYDVDVIDDFLAFNAILVESLLQLVRGEVTRLIPAIEPGQNQDIEPDTRSFTLSARVKTKDTLLEKLQRMEKTPLMNVQDVAGLRFDCDLSLAEQTKVAELFAESFERWGATRVDGRDLRDNPHSGYRAVHLHIRSKAGRAEMQIRTAFQSKWANLYEEAADLFGRDIRYLHEGVSIPSGSREIVEILHEVSRRVAEVENPSDRSVFFENDKARSLRAEVYSILESIHAILRNQRSEQGIEEGSGHGVVPN